MASKFLQTESKVPELRIMLVGKVGDGKTSTMNALLGKKPELTAGLSASARTTECKIEKGDLDGQDLVVIDTPGLMFSQTREKVERELVEYAAHGPHVFLLVLKQTSLSQHKTLLQTIQKIFGEESINYTLALFTCQEPNQQGKQVGVPSIGNVTVDHHVFYNTGENHPDQVRKLLEKINDLVKKNNGQHYTKEMLMAAQEVKVQKMEKSKCDDETFVLKEKVRHVLVERMGEPVAQTVIDWIDKGIKNSM